MLLAANKFYISRYCGFHKTAVLNSRNPQPLHTIIPTVFATFIKLGTIEDLQYLATERSIKIL
jgi:hypothetical protein